MGDTLYAKIRYVCDTLLLKAKHVGLIVTQWETKGRSNSKKEEKKEIYETKEELLNNNISIHSIPKGVANFVYETIQSMQTEICSLV